MEHASQPVWLRGSATAATTATVLRCISTAAATADAVWFCALLQSCCFLVFALVLHCKQDRWEGTSTELLNTATVKAVGSSIEGYSDLCCICECTTSMANSIAVVQAMIPSMPISRRETCKRGAKNHGKKLGASVEPLPFGDKVLLDRTTENLREVMVVSKLRL